MKMVVAPPANRIVPIPQPAHLFHLHAVRIPACIFIRCMFIRRHIGHQSDAPGIGRPGEFPHTQRQLRQRAGLPAVRRHQPNLTRSIRRRAGFRAQQRQRSPVRRIARMGVGVAARKGPRFPAAVAVNPNPDPNPVNAGTVLRRVGVNPGQRIGALPAVRRKRRVGSGLQPPEQVGADRIGHRQYPRECPRPASSNVRARFG